MTYPRSKRLNAWLALTVLGSIFTLWAGLPAARAESSRYFSETGHTVSGKFLDYWNSQGGLAVFGYPLTEAQDEVDPETGKTFLTQWFERNRFELHPENAGTKYEVLLGLLGKDLNRENLGYGYPFTPEQLDPTAIYFKETQHNVKGVFLTYWQQNGGLERFGYPISAQDEEIDPETGHTFVTQWFERARFEYHPENKGTQYEVLLGLLGKQLRNIKQVFVKEIAHSGANGVTTDAQNNLYVLDQDIKHVFKYDSNGTYLADWGSFGTGDSQFYAPKGIVADKDGNIYVTDDTRVQKFDSNGHLLAKWGSRGTGNSQFNQARSVAVDGQGKVYVADTGNRRVQKFDSQGRFLLTWGSAGNGNGQFTVGDNRLHRGGPADIVADNQGNVYVTDDNAENPNIQKFDSNGQFIAKWSLPGFPTGLAVNQQGQVYALAASYKPGNTSLITVYNGDGSVARQYPAYLFMNTRYGGVSIAVDSAGFVYIAGPTYNRVDKYKLS